MPCSMFLYLVEQFIIIESPIILFLSTTGTRDTSFCCGRSRVPNNIFLL